MKKRHLQQSQGAKVVRCAIYTRKSTEEGLEQEFNTLDAQRDAGEAYIKSQQHEGWTCLPQHYDDGGFTGGNMDRPALKRLLADIQHGKVDCVIVYKVDRLSRSLMDFTKIVEIFDAHSVSFVSVTQQFNTSHSMGRLTLHILLSFAQFEREMISERTRDKIAATRRKGKWAGGMPLLGYTVVDTKLVVDPLEAEQVRQIFQLYLDKGSLLPVVKEINRRGWRTKSWTTKKGKVKLGLPFAKNGVYHLLTNPTYIGKVKYKDEVHAGEHEGIVDPEVFRKVQVLLEANGRCGGREARNKYGALLRGILRCGTCNCAMTHAHTTKGTKAYRYYVCANAQKRGWNTCPAPSVPAGEIERFVVDEIRAIGRDPALVAATVAHVREQTDEAIRSLEREQDATRRQRAADGAELRRLAGMPDQTDQLADVLERMRLAEERLSQISDKITALSNKAIDEDEVASALAEFDGVWEALVPREQARALELLIEKIEHDGASGDVTITFRPTGIKTLAAELAQGEAA